MLNKFAFYLHEKISKRIYGPALTGFNLREKNENVASFGGSIIKRIKKKYASLLLQILRRLVDIFVNASLIHF